MKGSLIYPRFLTFKKTKVENDFLFSPFDLGLIYSSNILIIFFHK